MKTFVYTLAIIFFVCVSCEGDQGPVGPEGPQGPPGIDGGIILPQVFGVEVDFLEENEYASLFEFPDEIEIFESDLVVVYHYAGLDTNSNQEIWEAMPHFIYFNTGLISYSYDHTSSDVNFYLKGNVDLAALDEEFRLDHLFRVAIIPADFFAGTTGINTEKLIKSYKTSEIKTYKMN